ncbi:hypothetical protein JTB14_027593 [Gonioctena quinquepunctata]|nr:hypothetical protein JTB14_027593 [Gonioctena quinquepunctata]
MASTSESPGREGRAAQKLNLSASPHRKKRYSSDEIDSTGFCGVIQRTPPPVPPALLRRIGVREVTGVGKPITRHEGYLRESCYIMLRSQDIE